MALANSAWRDEYLALWETPVGLSFGALDFTRSLRLWIDDGLMTLSFFMISLGLKPFCRHSGSVTLRGAPNPATPGSPTG